MIRPEIGKRYRTRDGREATLIAIGISSFSGSVGDDRQWHIWRENGWYAGTSRSPFIPSAPHPLDLIECIGESDE